MDSTLIPGLDVGRLETLLAEATGRPVSLVNATELDASSRRAPWKIEAASANDRVHYLLRLGESVSHNEVVALRAMRENPIPTPRVVYSDETGDALGTPVFVSEFIAGEALLEPMKAGAQWAIDLYIDTACALQAIRRQDLPPGIAEQLGTGESVRDVVEAAHQRFPMLEPLHEAAYRRLVASQPVLPEIAFSNGDLWPENLLIQDRRLAGVIDWQHAGWSDPLFEFLLPFFLVPELRNRGIEETYCERRGYDAALLHWYHGVEYFDSLAYVLRDGKPYEMHTAESLTTDLGLWLNS